MVEDDLDPVPADSAFADIAAVADTIKIPRKQRRVFKDAPPLIQPRHGETTNAAMAERLAAAKREQMEKQVSAAPRPNSKTVSYIECCVSECMGPGIWIIGDPTQTPLPASSWESSYKSIDSDWPNGVIPWCQCCYAKRKVRRHLKGIWKNGYTKNTDEGQVFMGRGIKANPRYIRTLSADETAEFWKSKE